jgi:hypothetical protein
MAETFKNGYQQAGIALADLVPAIAASTTAIVYSIRATNVDGTDDATVDVQIQDGASGTAYIAKGVNVPANSSVELLGETKVNLETTDKIQSLASAASDIDFFVSYLEIT